LSFKRSHQEAVLSFVQLNVFTHYLAKDVNEVTKFADYISCLSKKNEN